jgi:hypothetical protein
MQGINAMARRKEDSRSSRVDTGIGDRAGRFLDRAFAGAHRNKLIARQLRVHPNMAKKLRRGRGWTAARLGELAHVFGWQFVAYVFGPIVGNEADYAAEITERIERLQTEIRRLADEFGRGPLAPPGSGDRGVASGGDLHMDGGGLRDGSRPPDAGAWVVSRAAPEKDR